MSGERNAVLLIDDGELEDVREILDEMGVEFSHQRGAESLTGHELPGDLLIVTARRGLLLEGGLPDVRTSERPVRIAVAAEDSRTLRAMLRQAGFDFLVRRPVHPTALRLLILRALYRGPEKRHADRMPLGREVAYRTGTRWRPAMLAELSATGCRLVSRYGARPGIGLTLEIPAVHAGGEPLAIVGHVVRSSSEKEGAGASEISIAVSFDTLSPEAEKRLRDVLGERAVGPTRERDIELPADDVVEEPEPWLPGAQESDAADAPARALPSPAQGRERRRHRRGHFAREVIALRDQASRVLMGRDLSVHGMRVEPHPGLHAGDRVRVALYFAAREEPVLVDATAVRDDGPAGLVLRFDPIESVLAQRIEALVGDLPAVEALRDGEAESLGAVLSEILA